MIPFPRFITGQDSEKGLAGYLQWLFQGWGSATVASGSTSIAVAIPGILAGDLVFAYLRTAGANAAVVTSTPIVAGVGFTINVDTDPGVGGAIFNYEVRRGPLP